MVNKALFSSKKEDWCTPHNIVTALNNFGPIELDPCGNHNSIVPAKQSYFLERSEDGLVLPWKSTTYCNPPYGRGLIKWINKAMAEARNGVESLLLVPARTDTKWFHAIQSEPANNFWAGICLIKGRLTFLGAPSGAPFPSMIVYLGRDTIGFSKAFGALGKVVYL